MKHIISCVFSFKNFEVVKNVLYLFKKINSRKRLINLMEKGLSLKDEKFKRDDLHER